MSGDGLLPGKRRALALGDGGLGGTCRVDCGSICVIAAGSGRATIRV